MITSSLIFIATLLSLTSTSPTHTTTTTTTASIPSNRATAFPICGTKGFTEEPGDHYVAAWPPAPVGLSECVRACRRNTTCKAVSYAAVYELCSLYGLYMKDDQLDRDPSSDFAHYDDFCRV